jgi:hypothetical protein
MTFKKFWPRYLEAHSLPGTRSLHYFATVVGLISVVEAIVSRQPLPLAGIGLGYAIAIGAHRFIELNRPMIRVNAFWGMVADARMCWLALTGGLRAEIDASIGTCPTSEAPGQARSKRKRMHLTPAIRVMLLGVAAFGLAAGLLDFDDLFEIEISLHYALVQLGAPIAAFAGALFLGLAAIVTSFSAPARGEPLPMSPAEESLWRASIALLAFGGLALMLAELAEHGASESAAAIAFGALTSLIAITPALLIGAGEPPRSAHVAPESGIGIVLAKGIGGVGGAACAFGAIGILGWQVLHWITAGWQPLPLRAALTEFGVGTGGFIAGIGWLLDAPAAVAACVAAVIFALIALRAAALERQRKETWLFRSYMHEVRGSGPTRPMSDGSPIHS